MEDLIATEPLAEVSVVVAGYLEPAVDALRRAAILGDPDAVRAYALEVAVLAGTVAMSLPSSDERPPAVPPRRRAPLRAPLNRRRR